MILDGFWSEISGLFTQMHWAVILLLCLGVVLMFHDTKVTITVPKNRFLRKKTTISITKETEIVVKCILVGLFPAISDECGNQ